MDNGVFISYSHKDAEIVEKIARMVKDTGAVNVWYDIGLRGGRNFFSVIANQIIESRFFVFVVSAESAKSDWCLRELEFAASERKIIVPIWLENTPVSPRVKLVIQNLHYINYYLTSDEEFYHAIQNAFSEDAMLQNVNTSMEDGDRDTAWEHTYFLTKEQLKTIEFLISIEKQDKYSVCFQPEHAILLGLAYEMGIKVKVNLKKARLYYRVSAFRGNHDGKYLYASLRRKQSEGDSKELFAEMTDAAKHHSIFALTYLGDDYYFGRNGCEKNIEKAFSYYKEAAAAGGITAMYYMAYGYWKGEGVQADPELACMYALMAKEYGFPRSYRILGYLYEYGDFFEQDYSQAIEHYREAVNRGDYTAFCSAGRVYGKIGNIEKKAELYKRAVDLADAGKINTGLPYYRMGCLYEDGEGVSKDLGRAVEYYLQAAARQNASSLKYTVSTIMDIENSEQREAYLHQAFDLGCKDAAYQLGIIEKEKGDSENLSEEAIKYFVFGAESGDNQCVLELVNAYSWVLGHGEGRKNRSEAIRWFEFLFAHADEDFLSHLRAYNVLQVYYYAFAIELDYDPDYNMPDRKLVQLYFEKSLNESPMFFGIIVRFIVDEYLFPNRNNLGLSLDVLHAEEMMEMLEKYIDKYHAFLLQQKEADAAENWDELTEKFERGYKKIGECYRVGNGVKKSRAASIKYMNRAEELSLKMKDMAKSFY